jgi:hypothetical protein
MQLKRSGVRDVRVRSVERVVDVRLRIAGQDAECELVECRFTSDRAEASLVAWHQLRSRLRQIAHVKDRFAGLYVRLDWRRCRGVVEVPRRKDLDRFVSEFVALLGCVTLRISPDSSHDVLLMPRASISPAMQAGCEDLVFAAEDYRVCGRFIQSLAVEQCGNHRGNVLSSNADSPGYLAENTRLIELIDQKIQRVTCRQQSAAAPVAQWLLIHSDSAHWTSWIDRSEFDSFSEIAQGHLCKMSSCPFEQVWWMHRVGRQQCWLRQLQTRAS